MFNNFFPEICAVYEIMWKNIVEPERPQITKWRMRTSRCVPKAKNISSEYVILITFPLQHWLHEFPQYYVIRTGSVLFSSQTGLYSSQ
jgi:hypothetical protein